MGQRIGVIGAGYVGLVTGACLASLGHQVTLRDIDPAKVDMIQGGEPPIHEDGLRELMHECSDRLAATLDLREMLEASEIVFIAVDTPPTHSGDADLSRVMSVVDELEQIGPEASAGHVLVMKSTVPVGTGERVRAELDKRGLTDVGYCSNPEFLKEGVAIADFLSPDRVVVGDFRPADGDKVAALYAPLGAPILRTSVPTAEMIKYASNAFLATKISFINEIANVCERVDADVEEVARGMGLDRRIGSSFLRPGIGYGGSCFPKDVTALKQLAGNTGYQFQLLSSVIEVNELQKRRVIGKLQERLDDLRGRRIALLGLAFKPNTDDMREASSIVLAGRLVAEGAEVTAFDPVAGRTAAAVLPDSVRIGESLEEVLADADAAVIVTEWPQFRTLLDPALRALMRTPLIVDGRNLLDPVEAAAAGYAYVPIGRGDRDPDREPLEA